MLRNSWRAVPLALRVASIMTVLVEFWNVFQPSFGSTETFIDILRARESIEFAALIAAIVGALELVEIVPIRRRFGARLITAGWMMSLTLSCLYLVLTIKESWMPSWGLQVMSWIWFGCAAAIGVGFAWIAWKKPVIAIAGCAVWLIAHSPPPVSRWLYDNHHTTLQQVGLALYLLGTLGLLALAMVAVSDVPAGFVIPEPRRAKFGYRMLEHSMWWRLMATVLLILLTFMIAGARDPSAISTAITLSSLISGGTFMWFAFGAFTIARSNIEGVSRALFIAAGLGSGWCGAITLSKLASGYGADARTHAFEFVLPLVAAITLVLVAIGIAKYAANAGAVELEGKAWSLVWLVVILQVGSSLMQYALRHGEAREGILLLTVLLVICGVVVIASTARVAGAAAESITDEAPLELPVAKLI